MSSICRSLTFVLSAAFEAAVKPESSPVKIAMAIKPRRVAGVVVVFMVVS
jgi:hypothetical protein